MLTVFSVIPPSSCHPHPARSCQEAVASEFGIFVCLLHAPTPLGLSVFTGGAAAHAACCLASLGVGVTPRAPRVHQLLNCCIDPHSGRTVGPSPHRLYR